jgi:hypothetical protein
VAGYPLDSLVTVWPYDTRINGDTATIGDFDRQVFLEIPAEGLEILESLSAGNTVGETVARYERAHAEQPDIEPFLAALEFQGFVAPQGAGDEPVRLSTHRRGWSVDWISPRVAARLVGVPVLVLLAAVIAAGAAVVHDDPGLLPTPSTLLYPHHFALLTWATAAFTVLGIGVHEMGHAVAARAAGVPARIGIGNRMYIMVAQTDMTGIWMASKRERYVAFVMGPVLDAAVGSALLTTLWASQHGFLSIPWTAQLLLKGFAFTCMMRILWQMFVFVRTDGYYVLSTALGCKSLLKDTENYLRNGIARLRGRAPKVDQSAIPRRERRVIRVFVFLWVAGRVVALFGLIFAGLPLLINYLYQVVLWAGGGESMFGSADFLTIFLLAMLFDFSGLIIWLTKLTRPVRKRWAARLRGRVVDPLVLEAAGDASH